MKKLMIAAVAGVALAVVAETKDWQVYSFTETAKVFNVAKGKVDTAKTSGLVVYDETNQVFACTWTGKKDVTFANAKNAKKNGKKAYKGEVAEVEFFTDAQEAAKGKNIAYGYAFGKNVGYGTGTAKSVKGNFVGEKVFGTWQLKLDAGSTKKFAKGSFEDINDLLEAKNVEVAQ